MVPGRSESLSGATQCWFARMTPAETTVRIHAGSEWWVSPLGLLVVVAAGAVAAAILTMLTPPPGTETMQLDQTLLLLVFAGLTGFIALWERVSDVEITPSGVTCVGALRRDELDWGGLRPVSPLLGRSGGLYVLRGRRADGTPSRPYLLTMTQARAVQRWPGDHGRPELTAHLAGSSRAS
jgi:hypothetical protein